VSYGEAGNVRLWDINNPANPMQLGAAIPATGMAISPNGQILAVDTCKSGCNNDEIQLWDIGSHQRVASLNLNPSTTVTALAFSPDGGTLTASIVTIPQYFPGGATIAFWDVQNVSAPARRSVQIITPNI